MLESLTLGQIIGWLATAGAASAPTVIMTIMWWLELRERRRLQGVVEGYLPTVRSLARTSRAVRKVVFPSDDADDEDG